MGVIKPTLTLTANASSATTDAGPMSIALSLSASDSHTVDKVLTKLIDVKGDHTASDGAGVLFDASDYTASGDAGTDGGWVYIKIQAQRKDNTFTSDMDLLQLCKQGQTLQEQ